LKIKEVRRWGKKKTKKLAVNLSRFFKWARREEILRKIHLSMGMNFNVRGEDPKIEYFDWDDPDFKKSLTDLIFPEGLSFYFMCCALPEFDLRNAVTFKIKDVQGGGFLLKKGRAEEAGMHLSMKTLA
jgi:hypothetical protein